MSSQSAQPTPLASSVPAPAAVPRSEFTFFSRGRKVHGLPLRPSAPALDPKLLRLGTRAEAISTAPQPHLRRRKHRRGGRTPSTAPRQQLVATTQPATSNVEDLSCTLSRLLSLHPTNPPEPGCSSPPTDPLAGSIVLVLGEILVQRRRFIQPPTPIIVNNQPSASIVPLSPSTPVPRTARKFRRQSQTPSRIRDNLGPATSANAIPLKTQQRKRFGPEPITVPSGQISSPVRTA